MKKILILLILSLMTFLVGCDKERSRSKYAAKAVVVSYSQTGTSEKLVPLILKEVWADEIRLSAKTAYPTDYAATVQMVKSEIEENRNPELHQGKFNLAVYDTVYLVYPIWFGTFARPIRTFLDSNDLSGKVIIPFCTYGSGGLQASVRDIKSMEPGATVLPGYGISKKRMEAGAADDEVMVYFEKMRDTRENLPKVGGFTDFRPLFADDSLLFNQVMADYSYLKMVPKSVATQVVAGTNYKFIVEMTEPSGNVVDAEVNVFKPLPGRGEPQMMSVEKQAK